MRSFERVLILAIIVFAVILTHTVLVYAQPPNPNDVFKACRDACRSDKKISRIGMWEDQCIKGCSHSRDKYEKAYGYLYKSKPRITKCLDYAKQGLTKSCWDKHQYPEGLRDGCIFFHRKLTNMCQ